MTSTSLHVQFKEDTVFAGEYIECILTFKNTGVPSQHPGPAQLNEALSESVGSAKKPDPARGTKRTVIHREQPPPFNSHEVDARDKKAHASGDSQIAKHEAASTTLTATQGPHGSKHTRRVSIVSVSTTQTHKRPVNRHARSISAQSSSDAIGSRQRPVLATDRSVHSVVAHRHAVSQSMDEPLANTACASLESRNKLGVGSLAEQSPGSVVASRPPVQSWSPHRMQETFPSSPKVIHDFPSRRQSAGDLSMAPRTPDPVTLPQASYFGAITDDQLLPSTQMPRAQISPKHFSVRSIEGSPRSSFDVGSNHSNETLTSELAPSNIPALPDTLSGGRRSLSAPESPSHDSILMGYVQLSGHFTLDGSLVNPGPFEDVKRRAVIGGQGGGGVVGITRGAANGGLWSSLNWSSIGESLGALVGPTGPSTMKEMKGIAGSSSIPLLSTPKSILFVNLKLGPGQSRSFRYKMRLPRGLAPSHKGRAIKVFYNVIVGTHRAGSRNDDAQAIKEIGVPFRVLSGVNALGERLGHDLMSPYIMLKDDAKTTPIQDEHEAVAAITEESAPSQHPLNSTPNDFHSYVEYLLNRPRSGASHGLLSPSAESPTSPLSPAPRSPQTPRTSKPGYPSHASDASHLGVGSLINEAIRQSTSPSSAIYSPSSYTIARASIPIATLTLSRPALKIGDTLTCVVDFSTAELPCYAFEATLESSENVDPTLAIRSPQSVKRATRKVWATTVQNTIWAQRCVFRAQVPVHATPAFVTSGVSLDWCLRFALVVGLGRRQKTSAEGEASSANAASAEPQSVEHALEATNTDERGTTLAAKQYLPCESFEVEIPLRVFGAVMTGSRPQDEVQRLYI